MSLKNLEPYKSHIHEYGFSVINNVFSDQEVEEIISLLNTIDTSRENFRKSEDLFAIRQFLKEIPETIDWTVETEEICKVEKGGVMLMKPLTLHSSNRTTNGKKRRVIHIEFSDMLLPEQLNWSEKMNSI